MVEGLSPPSLLVLVKVEVDCVAFDDVDANVAKLLPNEHYMFQFFEGYFVFIVIAKVVGVIQIILHKINSFLRGVAPSSVYSIAQPEAFVNRFMKKS